jgi:CBS domain-containing protein
MTKDAQRRATVRDVVQTSEWDEAGAGLAELLLHEAVDLATASTSILGRGTPVYVSADAEVVEVQSLMARHHIRRALVLDGDRVIGIVDLVELAESTAAASAHDERPSLVPKAVPKPAV